MSFAGSTRPSHQRSFDIPFIAGKSLAQKIRRKIVFSGPITDTKSLVLKSIKSAVSSIATLLNSRRPPAIRFFIIPIHVRKSIDAHPLGLQSHILKEIFKLSPSFTDLYSAAAIIFKCFFIWISTSSKHPCPGFIFRRQLPATCMSMCAHELLASATLDIPARKVPQFNDSSPPAVAQTFPIDIFSFFLKPKFWLDCYQKTELLIPYISNFATATFIHEVLLENSIS